MISFVIPAYNEESLLGKTLAALFAAARSLGEPFEVIVADDGSTDRTPQIAQAQGARVVTVNRRHIAAARNAGAREAKGEVLVFVDADTVVNASTLRAMQEALREGAAGGGARVDFDHLPALVRGAVKAALAFLYDLLGLAGGCFLFARRDAFRAAGGFDERYFASEEVHLSRALKKQGKFVILRPPVITSGRKLRPRYFWKLFLLFLRLLVRGPGALRQRKGLEIWYDGSRDP